MLNVEVYAYPPIHPLNDDYQDDDVLDPVTGNWNTLYPIDSTTTTTPMMMMMIPSLNVVEAVENCHSTEFLFLPDSCRKAIWRFQLCGDDDGPSYMCPTRIDVGSIHIRWTTVV
jgi:hypothetical protein